MSTSAPTKSPALGLRDTWLRPLLGVARRELVVMFTSPLAFIAVAAFVVLTALLFWLQLLQFEATQTRVLKLNDPSITALLDFNDLLLAPVFVFAQVVLLFVAPLLCMRLFADEERRGTAVLLYGSPARTSALVLGKLTGVVAVLTVCAGTLFLYPALLAWMGEAPAGVGRGDGVVDWAQAALAIAALLCTGILYAAIGAAVSASTRSPAVALLVTSAILLGLWFCGSAAPGIDSAFGRALAFLAPAQHLENPTRGVLAASDVGYFASAVVMCLLCTHRLVDARRAP